MNETLVSYIAIREERFSKLSSDYEHIIREAIEDFGGMASLSRALGEHDRYIAALFQKRLDFKTRRKTALRIADLYRTKNLEHAETGSGSD